MLLLAALTFALVVTCTLIHYEALSLCHALLPRAHFLPPRTKVLAAVGAALVSHVLQISIFAAAYYFLQDNTDLGRLTGQFDDSFMVYAYFSVETYTSLGLGDIYPLGSLRMLAGMETLTGLLMIGWTASFTYLEMSRYWTHERGG
jgi:hypothetical protein